MESAAALRFSSSRIFNPGPASVSGRPQPVEFRRAISFTKSLSGTSVCRPGDLPCAPGVRPFFAYCFRSVVKGRTVCCGSFEQQDTHLPSSSRCPLPLPTFRWIQSSMPALWPHGRLSHGAPPLQRPKSMAFQRSLLSHSPYPGQGFRGFSVRRVRDRGSEWIRRSAQRRRCQPERASMAQPGRMRALQATPQSRPYLFGLIRTYLEAPAILPPKRRGCLAWRTAEAAPY